MHRKDSMQRQGGFGGLIRVKPKIYRKQRAFLYEQLTNINVTDGEKKQHQNRYSGLNAQQQRERESETYHQRFVLALDNMPGFRICVHTRNTSNILGNMFIICSIRELSLRLSLYSLNSSSTKMPPFCVKHLRM